MRLQARSSPDTLSSSERLSMAPVALRRSAPRRSFIPASGGIPRFMIKNTASSVSHSAFRISSGAVIGRSVRIRSLASSQLARASSLSRMILYSSVSSVFSSSKRSGPLPCIRSSNLRKSERCSSHRRCPYSDSLFRRIDFGRYLPYSAWNDTLFDMCCWTDPY